MLLFSYAKSGKLNESENKMQRVHAKGVDFRTLIYFQGNSGRPA